MIKRIWFKNVSKTVSLEHEPTHESVLLPNCESGPDLQFGKRKFPYDGCIFMYRVCACRGTLMLFLLITSVQV